MAKLSGAPKFSGRIVSCPSCDTRYRLTEKLKSDEVTCSKCRFSFHIPTSLLWGERPTQLSRKIDYHPTESHQLPRKPPTDASPETSEAEPEEARERPPLRGIKISGVEVPGWVVAVLLLGLSALAVTVVASPTAHGHIIDLIKTAQGIHIGPNGKEIRFKKTFTFWVPEKSDNGSTYPQEQFNDLHHWLTTNFGGWTRWRVQGAGSSSNTDVDGFFYQASLPEYANDKKPADVNSITEVKEISIQTISAKVTELFRGATPYVIEQPHYSSTRDGQ